MYDQDKKIESIKELNKLHLDKISNDLDLVKQSYRWRIGSAIVRLMELLMLKKTPLLSIDKIEQNLEILKKINSKSSKKKARSISI